MLDVAVRVHRAAGRARVEPDGRRRAMRRDRRQTRRQRGLGGGAPAVGPGPRPRARGRRRGGAAHRRSSPAPSRRAEAPRSRARARTSAPRPMPIRRSSGDRRRARGQAPSERDRRLVDDHRSQTGRRGGRGAQLERSSEPLVQPEARSRTRAVCAWEGARANAARPASGPRSSTANSHSGRPPPVNRITIATISATGSATSSVLRATAIDRLRRSRPDQRCSPGPISARDAPGRPLDRTGPVNAAAMAASGDRTTRTVSPRSDPQPARCSGDRATSDGCGRKLHLNICDISGCAHGVALFCCLTLPLTACRRPTTQTGRPT